MFNSPQKEKNLFTKNQDQVYIKEINQKISAMKNSQFRTTNFSLIEFFVANNFRPLIIEEIVSKLLKDYKSNPKKYILSNDKGSFKSEKNFKKSIYLSIARNKAFIKGPGSGQLSLNLCKTVQYLNTMYKQYICNSTQIKTPYKLFSNKRSNNRISSFSTIKEIKEENKSTDEENMEIEEENEIPKVKSQFLELNKNNKIKTDYSFGSSSNKDSSKKGKEPIINLSKKSHNFPSTIIKKEVKKDNKDYIPEIFHKKLYPDIFISNVNNQSLTNLIDSLNKFYLNIKTQKMNEQIKREIEKINNFLHTLYNNKVIYDEHCTEIKKWQNEIYTVFKMMSNQLKSIRTEINLESYSYDIYVQLRELIFKYEGTYNNIVEKMNGKLNGLKDIEKELKENRKSIQNCLNGIHNSYGFSECYFSGLFSSIEEILKINTFYNYNNLDNNVEDDTSRINNIIEKFKEEKNQIITEINGIDKYVGNITIY